MEVRWDTTTQKLSTRNRTICDGDWMHDTICLTILLGFWQLCWWEKTMIMLNFEISVYHEFSDQMAAQENFSPAYLI